MNSTVSSYLKICSDIGTSPIPELLSCLSAGIKECSISSPTEVLQDGQVIALCAVVPLSSIEELCFHNLTLNINSWIAIADSCSKCKSLAKLTLNDCTFKEGQGMATFARALGAAELRALDISSCMLGDEFAATLAGAKLLACDRLESVRLVQCNLTCYGATALAKAFEGVGMMSNLKSLDLGHNRIGDKGACALAAMLISEGGNDSSSVPLQALELEGNCITDVGGLMLCKAAKGALVLSRLNLSLNSLTEATLVAMTDALRFNTGTLKEVELSGCRVKGEDAVVGVIKAATKNNSLHLLDLRGAPLGPDSVAHLCQMLRYSATLNTLRVDVASREGAEILARELPHSRSLMHLTIGGPVPDALLSKMSEILAVNTMRAASTSPSRTSPHIHAWIEGATLAGGRQVQQQQQAAAAAAAVAAGAHASPTHGSPGAPIQSRSRSPSPGPGSARRYGGTRSETGGSVYSHNTYNTHRTSATAMSFQFSQMSRRASISTSPNTMRINSSLAAGGTAERAAVIFRKHDLDQDNNLSRKEMLEALKEVGVLNGIKARHVGRYLDSEFKKADADKDGKISLQDFAVYYDRISKHQQSDARESRIRASTYKTQVPVGAENNAALKRVFKNYCKYALGQGRQYSTDPLTNMNLQQFNRLCQDACFVEPEGRVSTIGVEVVFYRYRPQGSRRLAWKDFLEAIAAVAYEAGLQFDDVLMVLGCKTGGQPLNPDEEGGGLAGEGSIFDGSQGMTHHTALESIKEIDTPAQKKGSKKGSSVAGGSKKAAAGGSVAGGKKGGLGPVKAPESVSNPLFESIDEMARALRVDSGAVATESARAMDQRLALLEAKLVAAETVARSHETSRAQDLTSRMLRLENGVRDALSKQEEMGAVSSQMESLQGVLGALAGEISSMKGGSSAPDAATTQRLSNVESAVHGAVSDLRALSSRVDGMAASLLALQGDAKRGPASSGGGQAADAAGAAALEKKMMERQARFEGALMQVARQVDLLDTRIREEQESSLKALEALIAQSGLPAGKGAVGARADQGAVPV